MPRVYQITGVNPQPWVAPNFSAGGKGMRGRAYADEQMKVYKLAVKDELQLQNAHLHLESASRLLTVRFYLWRQLEVSDENARHHGHEADATNCQKSLEDALQGLAYGNDRRNRDVRTVIVEQTRDTIPHILIVIDGFKIDAVLKEVAKYPRPTHDIDPFPNILPETEIF